MKPRIHQLPPLSSICLSCRFKSPQPHPNLTPLLTQPKRSLATGPPPRLSSSPFGQASTLVDKQDSFLPPDFAPPYQDPNNPKPKSNANFDTALTYKAPRKKDRPHRLHIYATRHNCHITLTTGSRLPLLSLSAGNLGFRKANRGTYDAAYQLAAFMMGKINGSGMLNEEYPGKGGPIRGLEVVLRDFGPGREAASKILLGNEGRRVREKVVAVMDSTRLKHGGTRSPKPRRLG